jgi:hypothetical protein
MQGNISFEGKDHNADTYWFQLFDNNIDSDGFLGGFSAISMIIVSSISLATISNNLLIPYGFIGSLENCRKKRTVVKLEFFSNYFGLCHLQIIYFRLFTGFNRLSSICGIAQLAPSFLALSLAKRLKKW